MKSRDPQENPRIVRQKPIGLADFFQPNVVVVDAKGLVRLADQRRDFLVGRLVGLDGGGGSQGLRRGRGSCRDGFDFGLRWFFGHRAAHNGLLQARQEKPGDSRDLNGQKGRQQTGRDFKSGSDRRFGDRRIRGGVAHLAGQNAISAKR